MIPLLLLGGIALAGVAIGVYWKNIAKWLKNIWKSCLQVLKKICKGQLH